MQRASQFCHRAPVSAPSPPGNAIYS
ncbi:protein of unknown function [Serratia sp. Tan611]|nr:protein of unknown function [Serratia sp. Tan611]